MPKRIPGPICISRDESVRYHVQGGSYSLTQTPGSWGHNDCSDPNGGPHLTDVSVRLVHAIDRDPDPKRLLDDAMVNPDFATAAKKACSAAQLLGLDVIVTDVYRSPDDSRTQSEEYRAALAKSNAAKAKYEKELAASAHAPLKPADKSRIESLKRQYNEARKHIVRAAPAWQSAHNYGLAMDVIGYKRDSHGKRTRITSSSDKWYATFGGVASVYGILWPNLKGDAGHLEYHPTWRRVASGSLLVRVVDWAMGALEWKAGERGIVCQDPSDSKEWMPFFWWAAGAGGMEPPADFLQEYPVPVQD